MLDYVASPKFHESLNSLLEGTGAVVADNAPSSPSATDCGERSVEGYLKRNQGLGLPVPAPDWWTPFGGKAPTWDLLCPITFTGTLGLLIVECKAHQSEMVQSRRTLKLAEMSISSFRNHVSIARKLLDANCALDRLGFGRYALSLSVAYQLSNRIAYLHHLASLGVPTVLMYLGWLRSPDCRGARPFQDHAAWNDAVTFQFEKIGPRAFLETSHTSRASFQMIVRSLPVSEFDRQQGSTRADFEAVAGELR